MHANDHVWKCDFALYSDYWLNFWWKWKRCKPDQMSRFKYTGSIWGPALVRHCTKSDRYLWCIWGIRLNLRKTRVVWTVVQLFRKAVLWRMLQMGKFPKSPWKTCPFIVWLFVVCTRACHRAHQRVHHTPLQSPERNQLWTILLPSPARVYTIPDTPPSSSERLLRQYAGN